MIESIFQDEDLRTVSEALDIAEDRTGDFFRFSLEQWKRHRYDVKTLLTLNIDEITHNAFALLNKYSEPVNIVEPKSRKSDFYFICIQDHQIAKALRRDKELRLFPLLIYIFTHELIHIIRFCDFSQRFEATGKNRQEEEKVVHSMTFNILKNLSLPEMGYVLKAYGNHRICEIVTF